MSTQRNQEILRAIFDVLRTVLSDGRLTYGDAVYIVEGLLQINWFTERDNLVGSHALTFPHEGES